MEGVRLIQEFESCVLAAYQDQGRIWTIAWGHTRGVQPGDICTQEQADRWLLEDLETAETELLRCVSPQTLNDNQVSALDSLVFNVGLGSPGIKSGFEFKKSGGPSTLLVAIHEGNWVHAADQFLRWTQVGGRESAGLLRRRLAEQALFMKPAPRER